jgi:hypothetical protein
MELDLEKLAKKRLYKLTGVVESFTRVNNAIGNLIVSKGSGSKKQLFKFTVMFPEIKVISELKKNYRIRIWFKIKTNQYGEKFFTELVIKYHEYWQVNELKKKREAQAQARIEEAQYLKSINVPFTNNDFINDAFDQSIVSNH